MKKAIALRITDKELTKRVEELAKEQGMSLNLTVNMLLGYAFNEVDKQGKRFTAKMLFEAL